MFLIPFLSLIMQLFLSFFFINFGYTYILTSINRTTMFWEILITLLLPLVILLGISLGFVISNPVWALLYILMSFVTLAILLLNIGIEFITFFYIIVYLGALMMLFLFVIMLFNLHALSQNSDKKFGIFKIIIVYFLSHIIAILTIENMELINISPLYSLSTSTFFDYNVLYFLNLHFWNSAFIFKTLYTDNVIFFILLTLILLYALIGALTVISIVDKDYKYISNNNVYKKSILLFIYDPFMQNYYLIIILFIIVSVLLCLLLCFIPYLLNARDRKNENTISEYECGFEPFDSAIRQPFTVEFYVIGILFLIFDVEIMLVLPWSLAFSFFSSQEIIIMWLSLILLALGFIYEASLGVLSWGYQKVLIFHNRKKKLISFYFLIYFPYYDLSFLFYSAVFIIAVVVIYWEYFKNKKYVEKTIKFDHSNGQENTEDTRTITGGSNNGGSNNGGKPPKRTPVIAVDTPAITCEKSRKAYVSAEKTSKFSGSKHPEIYTFWEKHSNTIIIVSTVIIVISLGYYTVEYWLPIFNAIFPSTPDVSPRGTSPLPHENLSEEQTLRLKEHRDALRRFYRLPPYDVPTNNVALDSSNRPLTPEGQDIDTMVDKFVWDNSNRPLTPTCLDMAEIGWKDDLSSAEAVSPSNITDVPANSDKKFSAFLKKK